MDDLSGQAAAAGCHVFPVRVYWEDTDASGIVYHASYLRFAERARTEFLRLAGIHQFGLMAETGIAIVVRRCVIDFRLPARLDDALAVETRITDIARASLRAEQTIRRAGVVLVHLGLQLACINRTGRPARLPPAVRAAIAGLLHLPAGAIPTAPSSRSEI